MAGGVTAESGYDEPPLYAFDLQIARYKEQALAIGGLPASTGKGCVPRSIYYAMRMRAVWHHAQCSDAYDSCAFDHDASRSIN